MLWTILIVLLVFALVWWLLSAFILPRLPEPFRTIIIVVCILILILYLLSLVGIGPGIGF